jgi:predicted nucleic acid-binding protein
LTGCVLDASAAIALLAPSQRTAAISAFASQGLEFIAPQIFLWEVRHAIVRLERRGLLPTGAVAASLAQLDANVRFVAAVAPNDLDRQIDIARQFRLGMYDATYLDLALREAISLASRDSALIAAAQAAGCAIIDLR